MTCHAVHYVTHLCSHVTWRYYYTAILIIGHVTQLQTALDLQNTKLRGLETGVINQRTNKYVII